MTSQQEYTTYEDIAWRFLNDFKEHFGLSSVTREATLPGVAGNSYEIEVLGKRTSDGADVIVECKHYGPKTHIDQEMVGGFESRMRATGAGGFIIVTTHELQQGAQMVAEYHNIATILIDHGSVKQDDYGIVQQIAQGLTRFFMIEHVDVRVKEHFSLKVFRTDADGNKVLVDSREEGDLGDGGTG